MCMTSFDWEKNDAKEKIEEYNKERRITWAVLEVTEKCNFNCEWCYANKGKKQSKKEMNHDKAKEMIDILAKNRIKQITFSGGEPTIYPNLTELVKYAKSKGIICHLNTNGYLFTKEKAEELAEAGVSQVQINIDSIIPEKHDAIRGMKESFEKAIQALKNAKEAGITCVSQTVITKKNENEVIEIFRLARAMGVDRCRISDVMPSEGIARENFELKPTDYISTLKKLAQFAYENGANHIETGEPLFPIEDTKIRTTGGFCAMKSGMLINVSVNGEVYPCATQRTQIFNLLEEKPENLNEFYVKKLEQYLSKNNSTEKCNECIHHERCLGGCTTRRQMNGEDYWCPL